MKWAMALRGTGALVTGALARTAAGVLWRAAGPAALRIGVQQQRSVGHVQGDKLRGNVLEAWEKREIAKIVATRNAEHFDEVRPEILPELWNDLPNIRFSMVCLRHS